MKSALLAAWVALAAAPAAAIPLEHYHGRLFLPVTVNGHATTALLDSAAEATILDDDFAARLHLAGAGAETAHGSGAEAMQARMADHVRIRAAGVEMDGEVAILDLGEVSGRLLGRPVTMLLGRDWFDRARLQIDIGAGRISVFRGPPRGVRLPVRDERGIPTIPASVEGHEPVATVIDTGNGTEILIGRAYAQRLGLTGARVVEQSSGGGLGGERRRDIVILDRLTIAGRSFRHVRAAIDPGETATDLNIGTSILRHFRIVTDFPNHAIWLEPRS